MTETIEVAFGKGSVPLQVEAEQADWKVIRPTFAPAIHDPQAGFRTACRKPIASPPLREIVSASDRVVIVTSDGTRPVPNRQLIPWILEQLPVPIDQVTVLLGNGTHRANTAEEIEGMFGPELARKLLIQNHDAYDPGCNCGLGSTGRGTRVTLDRAYVEADRRIAVGFIEPHFFAGFSGGAKGVAPGVAGVETILRFHDAELIAHPQSTWGVMEGNPIQAEIADAVALCPPDFLVNVTLNSEKSVSGFYVGDYVEAHKKGCEAARKSSMVAVDRLFPLVVTSNSGYPLDQNLYQTVKGISAAARVVQEGGAILVASECCDGIPNHGNFAKIMQEGDSPGDVLDAIYSLEAPILDSWQAQILAGILQRAAVVVYSRMARQDIEACKLDSTLDLGGSVERHLSSLGPRPSVAVLPHGPLTIPYLSEN